MRCCNSSVSVSWRPHPQRLRCCNSSVSVSWRPHKEIEMLQQFSLSVMAPTSTEIEMLQQFSLSVMAPTSTEIEMLQQFSWSVCSRRHRNTRQGPHALRHVSQQSPPRLPSQHKPMLVWLSRDRSRPRRMACRPLPCSTSLSFRQDRLVGLVVKASASRAEGPGFESRLRRDFFGVESYQ